MIGEPDPHLLAGLATAADAEAPRPELVSQAFAQLRSRLYTGRRNRTFVKRLLTLLQPRARLRPLPLRRLCSVEPGRPSSGALPGLRGGGAGGGGPGSGGASGSGAIPVSARFVRAGRVRPSRPNS